LSKEPTFNRAHVIIVIRLAPLGLNNILLRDIHAFVLEYVGAGGNLYEDVEPHEAQEIRSLKEEQRKHLLRVHHKCISSCRPSLIEISYAVDSANGTDTWRYRDDWIAVRLHGNLSTRARFSLSSVVEIDYTHRSKGLTSDDWRVLH
jgi:hypothetical protein